METDRGRLASRVGATGEGGSLRAVGEDLRMGVEKCPGRGQATLSLGAAGQAAVRQGGRRDLHRRWWVGADQRQMSTLRALPTQASLCPIGRTSPVYVPLNEKLLECKADVEFTSVSTGALSVKLARSTCLLQVC